MGWSWYSLVEGNWPLLKTFSNLVCILHRKNSFFAMKYFFKNIPFLYYPLSHNNKMYFEKIHSLGLTKPRLDTYLTGIQPLNQNGEHLNYPDKIEHLSELAFASPKFLYRALQTTKNNLKNKKRSARNKWTFSLFGKALKESSTPPIQISFINPFLGHGVFAKEDIQELSYIGQYVGVVRKRSCKKDILNSYIFGYVSTSKKTRYVIDAKEKGNFTRYINHSDEPNLTSRWIVEDGITKVIFFTNRLIKKGEQLCYDYGPTFWKRRSNPQLL